jgi:hypothetical protein
MAHLFQRPSFGAIDLHGANNSLTLLRVDQLIGLDFFHRTHVPVGPVNLRPTDHPALLARGRELS